MMHFTNDYTYVTAHNHVVLLFSVLLCHLLALFYVYSACYRAEYYSHFDGVIIEMCFLVNFGIVICNIAEMLIQSVLVSERIEKAR